MKRKARRTVVIAVAAAVACLLAAATVLSYRGRVQSEWATSEDGTLSLRLSSPWRPYARGRAFTFVAELRNDSGRSVTVLRAFGDEPTARAGGIRMVGPKGPVEYVGPKYDYMLGTASFTKLPPGKTIQGEIRLRVDDYRTIDAPGKYQVSYSYGSGRYPRKPVPADLWRGSIRSGTIGLVRR